MKLRIVAVAALLPLGFLVVGTESAAATAASGCRTRVASDFNGDGYADVATSQYGTFLAGKGQWVGGVQVDYGSRTGLKPGGSHYYNQLSPGVPGAPVGEGTFGRSLVSGYFNNDCFADLAIGDPSDGDDTGSVTVLYGSGSGLTTKGAQRFTGPAGNTGFGAALAAGDFNGDTLEDLAVGAVTSNAVGRVAILDGGRTKLGAPSLWLDGPSGAGGFGYSLAAGDFNGDGYADLAVGAPDATFGKKFFAGAVVVYRGSGSGITTSGSRELDQETPGIAGVSETNDMFGSSLAAGDVNGDGRADLVVGVPGEGVGTAGATGGIAYIPGTATGLTGAGSVRFSQATPGVPGFAQEFDNAGSAVAVGDVNDDGYADIAFGIPNDVVDSGEPVGSVMLLRGSRSGPTVTGVVRLSEKTAGIPGGAPSGARFGVGVRIAYVHGGRTADLVVGAYQQTIGTVQLCGYAVVVPGVAGTGPTGAGTKAIGLAANGPGKVQGADFGWTFA